MELWSIPQAAERLRCSPKVVRRYVSENRLEPKFRTGGDRSAAYFDPKDVEALADRLAVEAEERAASLREASA